METVLLSFFQPRDRRLLEEHPGAAGLSCVDVVEHGPERLLVELDGPRAGAAADGPARVVELDGVIDVPTPQDLQHDRQAGHGVGGDTAHVSGADARRERPGYTRAESLL